MGLEGQTGLRNTVSLGQFELPSGGWFIVFIDDLTGLYPLDAGRYCK